MNFLNPPYFTEKMKGLLYFLIIYFFLVGGNLVQAQIPEKYQKDCTNNVNITALKKYIKPGVCIPKEFIIEDIWDKFDMDADGKKDIILKIHKRYTDQKDTVAYCFFVNKGFGWVGKKTFINLSPPVNREGIPNYDIYNSKATSNQFSDRKLYAPWLSKVIFFDNTIMIKYNINKDKGVIAVFEYSIYDDNWMLTKKKTWEGNEGRVTNMLYEVNYNKTFPIDMFNLVNFHVLAN